MAYDRQDVSDLILFNTYNSTGTDENLREGTLYIRYGCSHPNQGMHTELCGGYTTGKTSKYHNLDWEIYGSSQIILCDYTTGKMYDLVYGSEKVDKDMELDPTHRYSIIIDSYGGTTTVTCPVCGYVKSYKGSYSVYVESYGDYHVHIKTNPNNAAINCDESASFRVAGVNIAAYQWQLYNNGEWVSLADGSIGTGGVRVSGAQSNNLLIQANRVWLNGKKVRCAFTGMDYQLVTSEEATLTVNDNRAPSLTVQKSTEDPTPNPVVVTLTAEDPDGLNATPYSFDGGLTYQTDNTKTVSENQTLNVAVRDNAGNVARDEVVIDNITEDAPEPEKVYLKGYVGKNGVAVRFL